MQATKNLSYRIIATTGLGAVLALGLGLGNVQAQQSATPQSTVQQSITHDGRQAMPTLTIRDVYDRVEAAGYRDLREIELEKGRWEVKALDSQGNPVKLYINSTSGEIEHIKHK